MKLDILDTDYFDDVWGMLKDVAGADDADSDYKTFCKRSLAEGFTSCIKQRDKLMGFMLARKNAQDVVGFKEYMPELMDLVNAGYDYSGIEFMICIIKEELQGEGYEWELIKKSIIEARKRDICAWFWGNAQSADNFESEDKRIIFDDFEMKYVKKSGIFLIYDETMV